MRLLQIFWSICLVFCSLCWCPTAYADGAESLRLGAEAVTVGDYVKALALFTQATESSPALGYGNRCLVYVYLHDYQAAAADCRQALLFDAISPETLLNLGVAYFHLGQYDDAATRYRQLLKLSPDDYRAYYNLGILESTLENHQKAIVHYTHALSVSSSQFEAQAEIYRDRGVSHMLLANYEAAINDLTSALNHNPKDLWAYFDRGCAYHRSQDYRLALQDFSWVIERDRDNAQAYLNRGMVFGQLGQKQAAIANLELALHYFQVQGDQLQAEKIHRLLTLLKTNDLQLLSEQVIIS